MPNYPGQDVQNTPNPNLPPGAMPGKPAQSGGGVESPGKPIVPPKPGQRELDPPTVGGNQPEVPPSTGGVSDAPPPDQGTRGSAATSAPKTSKPSKPAKSA